MEGQQYRKLLSGAHPDMYHPSSGVGLRLISQFKFAEGRLQVLLGCEAVFLVLMLVAKELDSPGSIVGAGTVGEAGS